MHHNALKQSKLKNISETSLIISFRKYEKAGNKKKKTIRDSKIDKCIL